MLKEEVLKIFEASKGAIVSGKEISQRFSVSRAAVWKAVENLKEDGYDIVSVHKKGYILNERSDILSSARLQMLIEGQPLLIVKKELGSTDDEIMGHLGGSFTVVCCDVQHNGKDIFGKEFLSPREKGAYCSMACQTRFPFATAGELTAGIYNSVKKTLSGISNADLTLKENAIYAGSKKLCGISVHFYTAADREIRRVAVGIGVNVYAEAFGNAESVSLYDLTGKYFNRSELIAAAVNGINAYLKQTEDR